MSALPEQYQKYAAPTGQHVQPAAIELHADADPIVHVPDPYNPNRSIAVRRSALLPVQPSPARDLTSQPLFDPGAQKILAAGVGSGVALWGGGQFLAGAGQLVSGLSGMGALVFFLAIAGARAALMGGRGGSYREGDTYIDVTNINRWWGKSSTRV